MKTFNVVWDETEAVTTRYWDTVELSDEELAEIDANAGENSELREAMRQELILERVREVTDYACSKYIYSETEDTELIEVEG